MNVENIEAETNSNRGKWRSHWKELVLLLALLLIALMFGLDIIGAGEAAALSTPLIAAVVAFSLYETVHDKRQSEAYRLERERKRESKRQDEAREQDRLTSARQQRSAAYLEIIEHGIRSFSESGFKASEATIRAQIALWGSDQFVNAYLSWRQAIRPYTTRKGAVPIAPQDQPRLQEALASLVSAARLDVDIDTKRLDNIKSLAAVLFDDYIVDVAPIAPGDT